MIKYELKCRTCFHQFEGWFVDSTGFETQTKSNEIACPVCAGSDIGKAIMAPNIARRRGADDTSLTSAQAGAKIRASVREMRRELEASSDNVGEAFPEEARKIYYGEVEGRAIHGEASLSETKDLVDEGIAVTPLPIPPESDA